MSMKPILFNTEMVHAIQSGTKTVTRRVVKSWYFGSVFEMFRGELCEASPYKPPIDNGNGTTTHFVRRFSPCKPPYRPGDILYVRETFCINNFGYHYRADWPDDNCTDMSADDKWHPSIHMPREAARIFLRVTDVRVERLQETTETQAKNEGAEPAFEYNTPEGPVIVFDEDGYYILGFKRLWNGTIKPTDRALYGWDANPWVWVIEFERCEKPKE